MTTREEVRRWAQEYVRSKHPCNKCGNFTDEEMVATHTKAYIAVCRACFNKICDEIDKM